MAGLSAETTTESVVETYGVTESLSPIPATSSVIEPVNQETTTVATSSDLIVPDESRDASDGTSQDPTTNSEAVEPEVTSSEGSGASETHQEPTTTSETSGATDETKETSAETDEEVPSQPIIGSGAVPFGSDTITVRVEAPEGAFPAGTTVNLISVDATGIMPLLPGIEDLTAKDIFAVDITFTHESNTVQSEGDHPVTLIFSDLSLETMETVPVRAFYVNDELTSATEVGVELGETDVVVSATHFSIYALAMTPQIGEVVLGTMLDQGIINREEYEGARRYLIVKELLRSAHSGTHRRKPPG